MAMTADRARAFGARTPWYRWRCIRGGGTNLAMRSRSCRGERRISVRPSGVGRGKRWSSRASGELSEAELPMA